jgi:hypothetical protein
MTYNQGKPPTPQQQPPPPPMPQGTSNLRSFWIVWCSMWALGWLLLGFVTLFRSWVLVPVSFLCILIPVGSRQRAVHQPQLTPRRRPRTPCARPWRRPARPGSRSDQAADGRVPG